LDVLCKFNHFCICPVFGEYFRIIVDEVTNIIKVSAEELVESSEIFCGLRYIRILNSESGIVLIYDLDSIIDDKEEIELQRLLESYNNIRD
jgi:chemotaxis signal transduction protein